MDLLFLCFFRELLEKHFGLQLFIFIYAKKVKILLRFLGAFPKSILIHLRSTWGRVMKVAWTLNLMAACIAIVEATIGLFLHGSQQCGPHYENLQCSVQYYIPCGFHCLSLKVPGCPLLCELILSIPKLCWHRKHCSLFSGKCMQQEVRQQLTNSEVFYNKRVEWIYLHIEWWFIHKRHNCNSAFYILSNNFWGDNLG